MGGTTVLRGPAVRYRGAFVFHQFIGVRFLGCKCTEFHPPRCIFLHGLPHRCLSVLESPSLRLCTSAFSSANFFGSLTIVMQGKSSFHEICRGLNRRHMRSLADTVGSML